MSTVKAEPRAGGRRFSLGKQAVFTAVIVIGFLVMAEGAIRVWALYFRESYERYNAQTGRLELRPNIKYTNNRGEEFWINSKGFVGPEFDDQPRPGVYRIIALGDSCTFATGFWQIGYPSMLERRLNAAGSRGRFEVINAGIEGYNSTFALERIREELLRYRPHLVIIYIGWNDLMKTDPANAAAVDNHRWLAVLLDGSFLVKAYRKLLFANLRPLLLPPTTEDRPGDAEAFDHFVPERYRSNLEAMIRLLRQHDAGVLLVTLPTVVRPGLTRDDLRRANVFFPYFPSAYGVARLLSLHRAYNLTIADVGRRERAEVVDLARLFEPIQDRSPYFWDTMHPNEKGGALIAEALVGPVRTMLDGGRR